MPGASARYNALMRYAFLSCMLVAAGCSPALDVRVETTAGPEANLTALRSFALGQSPRRDAEAFDLTEQTRQAMQRRVGRLLSSSEGRYVLDDAETNPALARYVASITRDTLVERGYEFDEAAPALRVSVDFVDAVYEEFGFTGTRGVIRASSDERIGVGVGVGGQLDPYPQEQHRTVHGRAVAIYCYDISDPDRLLWHGWAITTRTDADFQRIAPLLIEQVLGEFPHPSGRPTQRTIHPPSE